ncbi:hypothetical protein GF380_04085 [Candidatus Uhrbacteria bacterium]|nr:hypothetical protein [Candidatus Uhrbacteria bacterium]MBD3284263.1 hypothetical protein [Candidatus Uhrbacteria bacterium]
MELRHFLRVWSAHAIYALAIFGMLLLVMEWVIPGFITPYLDPIPFVMVALIVMTMDAINRHTKRSPYLVILTGAIAFVGTVSWFLIMVPFTGRLTGVVLALCCLLIVAGTALLVWPGTLHEE